MIISSRSLVAAAFASLLAACGPNLGNLACASSTECPTGYKCDQSSGKCVAGTTAPEITALTDVANITFTGTLVVKARVVDPAGIDSVSVQLGTAPAVAATESPAGSGIYTASIDMSSTFAGQDTTVSATITAKNKAGATTTATIAGIHIDEKGPAIGTVSITPTGTIYPGQPISIGVDVGESLSTAPVVTVAPPTGAARTASLTTAGAATHFDYSFTTLHSDPAGTWTVTVTAQDAFRNVTTQAGGTFTLHADVAAGVGLVATATQLKAGASTTITATFSKPVSALPTTSLAGSAQAVTKTSGAAGGTVFVYTINAPMLPSTEAGAHVLTITGVTVAGETVSSTVTLNYVFTPPAIAKTFVELDDVKNRDSSQRPLFHTQMPAAQTIHIVAILGQALTATATLDAGTTGARPLTLSAVQTDSLAPRFDLVLDATPTNADFLADGTHSVTVSATDAAGNIGTSTVNENFVVLSTTPSPVLDGSHTNAGVLAKGAQFAVGITTDRPLDLTTLQAGLTTCASVSLAVAGTYIPDSTHFGYTFAGTVPGSANGACTFTLSGADVYGNALAASIPSAIATDTTAPVIVWTASPSLLNGSASANATFTFQSVINATAETFTNPASGALFACLDPTPGVGGLFCSGASTALTVTGAGSTTATFTVNGGGVTTDVVHTILAGYTDEAFNVGTATWTLEIDGTTPALVSQTWTSTSFQQGGSATVTLGFSEPLNPSSVVVTTGDGVAITPTPVTIANSNNSTFAFSLGDSICDGSVSGNGHHPTTGTPFHVAVAFADPAGNAQGTSPITLTNTITCNTPPVINFVLAPTVMKSGGPASFSFQTKPAGSAATFSGGTLFACLDPVPGASPPCNGAVTTGFSALGGSGTTTATFSVTSTFTTDTNHVVLAGYTDGAGHTGTATTPLEQDGVLPALSASGWNRTQYQQGSNATVTLSFNEPVNSPNLTSASLGGMVVGSPTQVGGGTTGLSAWWQISVSATGICDGASGHPTSGTQYAGSLSFTDAAGNAGSASLPAVSCYSAPVLSQIFWNRTLIDVNSSATITFTSSVPLQTSAGSAALSTNSSPASTITTSLTTVNALTNTYSTTVTMPTSCPASEPISLAMTVKDASANTSSPTTLPSVFCTTAATILSSSYDHPIQGPGLISTLTLIASVPLNAVSVTSKGTGAGLTIGAISGTRDTWTIPITMPATCTTSFPGDGKSATLTLTLTDSQNVTSSPTVASPTCSESRISTSPAPNANSFFLKKTPMSDGTLRTFIGAGPGAVTSCLAASCPTPASSGFGYVGLTLVAKDSGNNVVGSAPVNPDGSVSLVQLSSPITQAAFTLSDMVGSSPTAVSAYPEEVDILFDGKNVAGNSNPNTAWDATGNSSYLVLANWLTSPTGPPAQTITELTPGGYFDLAYDDGVPFSSVSPSVPAATDPLGYQRTVLAGSPTVPPARSRAATADQYYNYGFYLFGGNATPGSVGAVNPDTGAGVVWQYNMFYYALPSWTKLVPTGATLPPALMGHRMAMNYSTGNTILVFGGVDSGGSYSGKIWQYNFSGNTWLDTGQTASTYMNSGGGSSFASTGPNYYFWNPLSVNTPVAMYQYGTSCTAYLMSYTTPQQSCGNPPLRYYAALAFDAGYLAPRQEWVLFGGSNGSGTYFSDLYLGYFSGSPLVFSWFPQAATNPPPGREAAQSWIDTNNGHLYIWGGRNAGGELNDAWEFNPTTSAWTNITETRSYAFAPSPRLSIENNQISNNGYYSNYQSLLFGGSSPGPTPVALNDTWLLGKQSRGRLLVRAPNGISNLANATGVTLEMHALGVNGYGGMYLWNGSNWEIAAADQYGGNSSHLDVNGVSPASYIQADGNIYALLETFQPNSYFSTEEFTATLHFK